MVDKIKVVSDQLSDKVTIDDLSGVKSEVAELKLELIHLQSSLDEVKDGFISKVIFEENLNEISLCFQESMNATPRPQHVDFTEVNNQLEDLRIELYKLKETKVVQPNVINMIRTAEDVDEVQQVPSLALKTKESSFFKKPIKVIKK
jgi:hypothetical protein